MSNKEILAGKHVLINTPPHTDIATLILAHGAGAAMDSHVMTQIAEALSQQHIKVIRFEFEYMAARRLTGKRAPPPNIEKLTQEWLKWLALAKPTLKSSPVFIGGKSIGGRVATLMNSSAMSLTHTGNNTNLNWQGVCCIGYPFHPNGQPEKIRTAHLHHQQQPILIAQGTRDAFGNKDEVIHYQLPSSLNLIWLTSADHDLKPLKKSGFNHVQTIEQSALAIAQFIRYTLHLPNTKY